MSRKIKFASYQFDNQKYILKRMQTPQALGVSVIRHRAGQPTVHGFVEKTKRGGGEGGSGGTVISTLFLSLNIHLIGTYVQLAT